ncbi:site-specific integrase [Elizabethkingia anophelis]|uniref:Site-specific tyrosine recombinase XerC n=1 Tax=Elizabethkingia anophelis TaxID=1117645 RepID=A0A7Z7PYI8_9FLAO|nr:site-specific integrase [Elizabethkingia anophelis]STF08911.1 site-specific tyrosine recombinase XerC [Elizabethkingia anophelis]
MKITLKRKNLKDGQISLYIEYYKGSTIDLNGKRIHLREFEYLKLYLNAEPKNAKEKKDNKETLELAENILAIRKTNYIQGKFDIKSTTKSKRTFLNYFAEIMEEKQKQDSSNNYGNWFSTFQHLKKIISPNMTFEEVDETFIKKVRNYIDYNARSKSDLPLSQNSKYSYFNKFKAALRSAFDDGYLSINYATKIKSFDQAESQREYLTFEELQSLSKSPCKYEILKRAFIFSCLTGIRWSDINTMTWSEVRDEGENSRINFRQEKTDGVEYLYISKQARDLLSERQSPEERVFKGLKYSMTYNTEIVRWCNRAGIFKHITFHSARHTNAVLLLEGGADIYTVSKRLGHREIRNYSNLCKIVDKKMKEAAEMIPELNIEL